MHDEELSNTIEVEHLYLELESVGANLGGGFTNTKELKVMKYREAINGPNGESWRENVFNDHTRMRKSEIFKSVDKENPSPDTLTVNPPFG